MKVELLTYTPNPDKIVAAAAKLCYAKSDIETLLENLTEEKTREFIELLSSLGHESPIEHVSFTFGIEGVSRSLLAQLTRHRIASYSVQSQRYVDKSGFNFITPPEIAADPASARIFETAMKNAAESYAALREILARNHTQKLLEGGMSPGEAEKAARTMANEDARFVLPNACDTRIIMTMNARSLMNFFALRCCNRAQWEIRALAKKMLFLVRGTAPALFKYAGPSCLYGACGEGSYSCKKSAEVRLELRGGEMPK